MSEKLTDEQVAELAAIAQGDLDQIAAGDAEGAVHLDGEDCTYCKKDRGLVALAVEVQQARARRCDACAYGEVFRRHPAPADVRIHCLRLEMVNPPDWSCGNFKPKSEPHA